jgi:polyhydroxybutyrate depolymerase
VVAAIIATAGVNQKAYAQAIGGRGGSPGFGSTITATFGNAVGAASASGGGGGGGASTSVCTASGACSSSSGGNGAGGAGG